jgi:hypothetical protein
MYNPRQARIQTGVNGGRFASYGDPHTSKASTKPGKSHKKLTHTAAGKTRKHPKRVQKQLTVSGRSKLKARTAKRAAHRTARARGRWR